MDNKIKREFLVVERGVFVTRGEDEMHELSVGEKFVLLLKAEAPLPSRYRNKVQELTPEVLEDQELQANPAQARAEARVIKNGPGEDADNEDDDPQIAEKDDANKKNKKSSK